MYVKGIWFSIIRMSRDYVGLLILLLVPLALITVLGWLPLDNTGTADGVEQLRMLSVGFVLSFQLFGGSYSMYQIREDLFSPRKWRLYSLPVSIDVYARSSLIAGTLFSTAQGFVLVAFTSLVYGVEWGSLGVVVLTILTVAALSQVICLIFVLGVRNFKIAERLSEVYGLGSMIFAGMILPLPDNGFLNFMGEYGNPISLGERTLFASLNGEGAFEIAVPLVIMAAMTLVFGMIAAVIGRRRLT